MTELDLLYLPSRGRAVASIILAHGAGAPMDSDYMNSLCAELSMQGLDTYRFEFPYMVLRRESGIKKPPDRQPVLLASWQQAYTAVVKQLSAAMAEKPLLIGGKSMGGRMASLMADELQADALCCFGYPFHPPGKPAAQRTSHFGALSTPTLILQGERDPFGKPGEVDSGDWAPGIQLVWIEEGDHDLKARKSSGLTQGELIARAAALVRQFTLPLNKQGS